MAFYGRLRVMRTTALWRAVFAGSKGAMAISRSRQVLMFGVGLSFVYPFFWWTFFYVSSLSFDALYRPGPSAFALVVCVAVACALLLAFDHRARRLLRARAWIVPVVAVVSSCAFIALHLDASGVLVLGDALAAVLAIVAGVGVCSLVFAWGMALAESGLVLRDCAMAVCGSAFLFFGYVLLFIGAPDLRFLLCLGSVASAALWVVVRRGAPSSPDSRAEGRQGDTRRQGSADTRRGAWPSRSRANAAPSSPSEWSLNSLLDWLPLVVSCVATSVAYWLLFSCDVAGAFPSESFELLGSSPIAQGSPMLYALFLLFLAVLFIALLSVRPHRYGRVLFVAQGVLAAAALVSLFALGYLVPGRVDVAEGLNCLIRANVQIALFVVAFLTACATGRLRLLLAVPLVDAALLLCNELLFAFFSGSLGQIAQSIPLAGFACGALVALCFVSSSVWTVSRTRQDRGACDSFEQLVDSLATEYALSQRERDVLALAVRGHGAKGIASELCIAPSTAQTHISRIYAKMDLHSKQELLNYVEQRRGA